MDSNTYFPKSFHSPLSTQEPCVLSQSGGQSESWPEGTHSQFSIHLQSGSQCAVQTLQEAVRFSGLFGSDGREKRGLVSVAKGSGGGFSSRETILAVKLVCAVDAPSTETVMVSSVGSDGVCHFVQTTWEPPAGITILVTV